VGKYFLVLNLRLLWVGRGHFRLVKKQGEEGRYKPKVLPSGGRQKGAV